MAIPYTRDATVLSDQVGMENGNNFFGNEPNRHYFANARRLFR